MMDKLALRQDADHPAKLSRTWGLHVGLASCIDCGWPVKLVPEARLYGGTAEEDTIVYVPRHGDPLGHPVTYTEATWVTDGPRTSSTKRHLATCEVPGRRGAKLLDEPLHAVHHLPVCKTCLELLDSSAEQDEDDD